MSAPYTWIRDAAAVQALADTLAPDAALFMDTEFMRERTFFPALALVQVHVAGTAALVDPQEPGVPEALKQLLSGRRWVMHSCSEDLQALRHGCGVTPDWVADTQVAAAFCGYDLQAGYQKMVKDVLDIDLPKDVTRSDWLQRPLNDRQLDYAAQDVLHLPALHEALMRSLEVRGRLDWWQEDCRRLTEDALREPDPGQLWTQVKGAGAIRAPAALARLQALAAWRDGCARARDLPRSFVVRDPELLALASEGASSAEQLRERGLHPSLVRRHGEDLLAVLDAASAAQPPEPLPGPPDAAERRQVKQLRAVVASLASALEVTPEVIARRRWLEAIVRKPDVVPEAMRGWRLDTVYTPLKEALA